ncbi:UDP-N-acetylmuramoyl-L-alanine:D-glutamate ligase [Georgfuchsia toluolica]|uniref:UDP-N-acetylmuramoylalanine--D-glutamate ligase n=1 Tax=Georgfuchsia toluolica TaxID=424218 RepID=A0A916N958_9PROT|nr:UDP-N-acetylmuramoyl-L-alanine--D-glutamate ligase [Georgfuchsia toluolica]CAG4884112.1 UDP-N-acetylmuramoyl-L-alanine:D-glutamate ligase [Georgfuchsia toluolica]
MNELTAKSVLILGLGESGLAMARWCARQGALVRVADTRAAPPGLDALRRAVPAAEFRHGEFDNLLLQGSDLLALSPGLAASLPVVVSARAQGIPVVGEIELFAQGLRDLGWRSDCKILAITGTNGKTTTTALTGHLCNAAGLDAVTAGNISPAALDALMDRVDAGKPPRIWVLELSSFQLETTATLAADAATVLNISDDHLDRYHGLDDYATAKARIFDGDGMQVLNRRDARVEKMARAGRRIMTFGLDAPDQEADFGLREQSGAAWIAQGNRLLLPLAELPLTGLHNAANAMAALALCASIGLPPIDLLHGLRTFRGLPHRVEKIASADGIDWYDDSKGTNVGATVAALKGMGRPVVLILGGEGKEQDFSPLRDAAKKHARAVVLIGRDALLIAAALGKNIPLYWASSMEDAVLISAQEAQAGDAVLLSPACASFDMFRNYEHRAQVFIAAVQKLLGVAT